MAGRLLPRFRWVGAGERRYRLASSQGSGSHRQPDRAARAVRACSGFPAYEPAGRRASRAPLPLRQGPLPDSVPAIAKHLPTAPLHGEADGKATRRRHDDRAGAVGGFRLPNERAPSTWPSSRRPRRALTDFSQMITYRLWLQDYDRSVRSGAPLVWRGGVAPRRVSSIGRSASGSARTRRWHGW